MELIDRQAALDIFDDYNVSVENGELEAYSRDRKRLCELQSVQPVATDINAGDTISRQTATEAVHNSYDNIFDFTSTGKTVADSIEDILSELPSIQPEPKEGHWIDKGWNGDWAWQIDGRGNCWRVIECSECGKSVSVESNYCPNCGADMKGEQDGNA